MFPFALALCCRHLLIANRVVIRVALAIGGVVLVVRRDTNGHAFASCFVVTCRMLLMAILLVVVFLVKMRMATDTSLC